MSVETISGAGPSGIDIAFERFGEPEAPPVLLVMGLGMQMLGWADEFCAALVDHRQVQHIGECRLPERAVVLDQAARRLRTGAGELLCQLEHR